MIPTLLLPGLVIGRWWLVPIAAVGWPVLLIVDGVGTGNTWAFAVSAGALAAGNVGIAVGVHRGAMYLLRPRILASPQLGFAAMLRAPPR